MIPYFLHRSMAAAAIVLAAAIGLPPDAPVGAHDAAPSGALPSRLADTGLYTDAARFLVDPVNRPFAPQYPLWTDGAAKRRWVHLPAGTTIDVSDVDAWEFPVGTKFWKEFAFGGRRVETRLLWKTGARDWVFASYAWNEAQTEAVLAPEEGIPGVVEVAPGRRHSIPSRSDCRACHETSRVEVLGFDALQLSTDRDPLAPHSEPLATDMITLRTLVDEGRLDPPRPELATNPPRIAADDPRTRAALGYLSTNCGTCHNPRSTVATTGMFLEHSLRASEPCLPALATTIDHPGRWVVPGTPRDASRRIRPGHPELSAVLHRMRSRRPSSQMPPLGTVLPDEEAIALLASLVRDAAGPWAGRPLGCAVADAAVSAPRSTEASP